MIMKRIVINADDFGKSSSVNEAILYAFQNGIINQTTIMATDKYFDEAVIIAKDNGFVNQIGLHLNLDEGEPLTENIKNVNLFCNTNGLFNRRFRSELIRSFWFDKKIRQICQEEIIAQMEKYKSIGSSLMHIDSHHHVHFKYSILSLLLPLAKEMGFKTMRLLPFYKKDTLPKRLYKNYANGIIKKTFETVDVFVGTSKDCEGLSLNNDCSYEIMLHPDIVNGVPVDVLKRGKEYLELNKIRLLKEK